MAGRLIPGFPSGDPLDLARATIYLPTRRAAAALTRELVKASNNPTLILPRIAPLGAFEPELDELFDASPSLGERDAVGALQRRMALAALTRKWSQALSGAIRRVGEDGDIDCDEAEPPLVVGGPLQAYALAGDLAALIDDMIIEDVDRERVKRLSVGPFDEYYRITLKFLNIAFDSWPDWLDERKLVDGARRSFKLVEREIAALDRPGRGPVIIAGSTGANRATARLIAAIARAKDGAVVLPDLDMDLDDLAFALAGGEGKVKEPTAGHAQTMLRRLLQTMEIRRSDVKILQAPPDHLAKRARVLSESLRPADTTALWTKTRAEIGEPAIAEALEKVKLIVADTEAEEALALAVAMRESLQTPGRRAALITPSAKLARRVTAELARWNIEVENSAGRTLASTPPAEVARLALDAALDFSPRTITALIEKPAVFAGVEGFATGARALQTCVLRLPTGQTSLRDVEATMAGAREAAADPHAHPAWKRLEEADFAAAAATLAALRDILAPLERMGQAPAKAFVEAHRTALTELIRDVGGGDREALEDLFDDWLLASEEKFELTLSDYAGLFENLVAATRAPLKGGAHPRLEILGLLEARLIDVDLALLGGLDETIWPPAPETDAFLNRAMRADLGLSPPERRIGQTAHDFVAALGAPDAILSRARKREGAPTVASRFLQRLVAFAGETQANAMQARGEPYLEWARQLDRAAPLGPAPRPEPRPPVELRPKSLSVTRIETLRRDPYAIYAERILRLIPLAPIGPDYGYSEVGVMWHAALENFGRGSVAGEDESERGARLVREMEAAFAPLLADPAFLALNWPRILKAMAEFLKFDSDQRALGGEIHIECTGAMDIDLPTGDKFRLTARADRIEILPGGGANVIDYKTGAPPSSREVQVGFAPQLTLQAAMLARGAFNKIPSAEAEQLMYLKLGGADGGKLIPFEPKDATLAQVIEAHLAGVKEMLAEFADPNTPYPPRPYAKFLARGSDYDHLARVREWAAVGDDEP